MNDINKLSLLNKKYDSVISLGYNCCPKKFIDSMNEQAFDFFDYFGTSMWGIIKIFEDNFDPFFDKKNYKRLFSLQNDRQTTPTLTNTRYNIRIAHDIKSMDDNKLVEDFFDKYKRRKDRMLEKINNSNNILFIRYEESMKNRIINNAEYNKKTEYEYLIDFTNLMKSKYSNKNIMYLFFSFTMQNNYNPMNNIYIVNVPDRLNYNKSTNVFSSAINKCDIIKDNL